MKIFAHSTTLRRYDERGFVRMVAQSGLHTLEEALENVQWLQTFSPDTPLPLLVDLRHATAASRDVQRFYSDPQRRRNVRSCALLVGSSLTRTLANILFRVRRPPMPLRVFNDEEAAIMWLLDPTTSHAAERTK